MIIIILVKFMYFVFTRMPGELLRRIRPVLSCVPASYVVRRVLITQLPSLLIPRTVSYRQSVGKSVSQSVNQS